MQRTHAHEHKYWAAGSGEKDETCEKRERSRSPRAASDADKYMKDSEKIIQGIQEARWEMRFRRLLRIAARFLLA